MNTTQQMTPQQEVRAVLREALRHECLEIFALIAKLRERNAQAEPMWVGAQAEQNLRALRTRFASLSLHGAEMFRFAELALIATLDEVGLARFGAGSWIELGPQFHCGLSAPPEILRHMQQHVAGKPLPREMIELYLYCLGLGFRGGGSDEQLTQIGEHLGRGLRGRVDCLFIAGEEPQPLPQLLHPALVVLLAAVPLLLLLLSTHACVARLDATAASTLQAVAVSQEKGT